MLKRVYLEITNACNLNCPFCTNEKGSSYMSLDVIKNHLDKIKEVCDYVYLHVLGEPLLHNDFDEILNYCDDINLNVQLVTNGLLLDKHDDLLKHKSLRKLSISLHSINNIEVNNSYFETINKLIENNLNKTIELRFYDNENLNTQLKTYLDSLYKKYDVKQTDRYNSYRLKDKLFVYYANLFKWPDINDDVVSKNGKCLGALSQIAILNDSRVTLCCLDPKGHNTIGYLKKNSLKEILESKEYKQICDNFRNNKLSKELCTKCLYRLRFDDKNS